MSDFLLELLSEEIPARMQEKACADLRRIFLDLLPEDVIPSETIVYATPRRLALISRGLPEITAPSRTEKKGPRVDAPEAAIAGFVKSAGVSRDELEERIDGKGNIVLFAVRDLPGKPMIGELNTVIAGIVMDFPWPKSMRWGKKSAFASSLRWVRPLHSIVALFGDDIVPFEMEGIASGAATLGHRFHHPGVVTIGNADDCAAKLRACHVIVDQRERQAIVRERAAELAADAGLALVPDEGLVAENAGLTEWPVPLLGRFDPAFLALPREVIQLSMRTNQKYFALTDADGRLAPNFICTANIAAADGGAAIVAGNAKVLAARLADARFFWDQDRKVPLAEQAKKLDRIVFHEKLGTVADKVQRVAKLARWLVEEGIVGASPSPRRGEGRGEGERGQSPSVPPQSMEALTQPSPTWERASLADMASQAALLCKADLVTGMVGEFPELQGIIGGYYARAEGYPDEVADAIRDHYKPVGQGDEVPTAPVTVAVSLADKLDTLAAFFALGETPTGSRDPFALRRSALGVLSLVCSNDVHISLEALFPQIVGSVILSVMERASYLDQNYSKFVDLVKEIAPDQALPPLEYRRRMETLREALGEFQIALHPFTELVFDFIKDTRHILDIAPKELLEFLIDRLKVQQREAGVRHDLIDAVFALGGEDDLVRLLARVKALQAFVATEDGANLLAGYRRAANIVRIEAKKDEGLTPSPPRGAEGTGVPGALRSPDAGRGERPTAEVGDPHPTLSLQGEGYAPEPAEAALAVALDTAEPAAAAAVEAEDFEGAMQALARLRPAVDAFFDTVTVNDPDRDRRAARLALLDRIRVAVHNVADFSRIEG